MAGYQVVIAGAGPTGLTLACALRSHGIDAHVIEQAPAPATTSRALGLQPRGREILARLGALGDLPQRAVPALATDVFVGNRRLMRFVVETEPDGIKLGPLVISQAEIERQLRHHLAELGGSVTWGCALDQANQLGDGVEVIARMAEGEQRLQAQWLVGCDGAHSRMRKLMDVAFEGRPFPETILLADVRLDWDRPRDGGVAWLHPDGLFLVAPLPSGLWRVVAELHPDDPMAEAGHAALTAITAGAPKPDPKVVERLQRLLRERVGDSTTKLTDPVWTSIFRFHRRLASAYRRGRMLLAGDAAHIHSALGGQGMNTGIGDAFNLGWKLAMVLQGRADDALLDTYQGERRPVAAEVVRETSRTWNIFLGRTALDRLLRDHLFLPLMRLPAIQRRWIDTGSQLLVSYRGGPLAPLSLSAQLARLATGAPVAGDRGPDARCRLASGEPTTLGAHAGANWALLLFGADLFAQRDLANRLRARFVTDLRVIGILPAQSTAHDDGDGRWIDVKLQDAAGAIARAYHAGDGSAVLLRPDGHIAARSSHPAQTMIAELDQRFSLIVRNEQQRLAA